MPTGNPREAPIPQSAAPTNAHGAAGPNTNSASPISETSASTRTTTTRPNRSRRWLPNQRAAVIAVRNVPKQSAPTAAGRPVAVDHRDADPVVRGPLREGEREHAQADEQGAGLAPAGQHTRRRPLGVLGCGRVGQEAPGGDRHDETDGDGDRQQVRGHGDVQGDHHGAEARAGHRADAEAGVEPRHDGPPQVPLDLGALHVHRDVPRAHGEAGEEQRDRQRQHPDAGSQRDAGHRGGHEHRHRRHGSPRPEAGDDHPRHAAARSPSRPRMPGGPGPARTATGPSRSRTCGMREAQLAKVIPVATNAA